MLSLLRIQNLAIVDELEVELESGLTVLTGETGAGKSIILKALELLTGRRASADLVRTGAANCTVEGLFRPGKPPEHLSAESEELQEIFAEEEILIRRVIETSGKSKIYINGRLSTAAVLQALAMYLIDITGQHQQQTLLDADHHLALLDNFGVPAELRRAVRESYEAFNDARRRLDAHLQDQNSRNEYFRRITFERDELREAGLAEGRRAELEAELRRLGNVETLTTELNTALGILESDDGSIDAHMRRLSTVLEQLASLDPALNETAELIETAAVQLNEAKILLSDYGSSLEADPDRLEALRAAVADIARIERKYGKNESELVRYLAAIDGEIAAFESGELDEAALRQMASETESALRALETKLTAERKASGKKLAKDVQAALHPLGMKHARFEVDIAPAASSPTGADKVEFLLAANPGEPSRPLAKVASGGELSRILLVLKTILNEKAETRTQVFDEVDTGIGGAVAQIVGEKLRAVSKGAQVLLVTHSPQIAAFADTHYLIAKSVAGGKTTTRLTTLGGEERVQHIASMLAGKKVSSHFEQSARELLSLRK